VKPCEWFQRQRHKARWVGCQMEGAGSQTDGSSGGNAGGSPTSRAISRDGDRANRTVGDMASERADDMASERADEGSKLANVSPQFVPALPLALLPSLHESGAARRRT
jgi:hypothetical protein